MGPSLYPKDQTWGIVVIALSALGACGGVALTLGGGILGAIGASAALRGNPNDTAAPAGIVGGLLAFIGIALLVSSVAQIAGGIGIMKSRRWGFVLTAIFSGISILLSLGQLPHGLLGVALNGVILYYCYQRLNGLDGPRPA